MEKLGDPEAGGGCSTDGKGADFGVGPARNLIRHYSTLFPYIFSGFTGFFGWFSHWSDF